MKNEFGITGFLIYLAIAIFVVTIPAAFIYKLY